VPVGGGGPTTTLPGANPGSLGDPLYPGLGNAGYDVTRYDLDLTLPSAPDDPLTGVVAIDAVATAPLPRFHLDLEGFEVAAVTVDGEPARFRRDGSELVVTPPSAVRTGAAFTVVVSYAGPPRPVSSAALGFPIGWATGPDGERYVAAEPDAAHSWFPANDHPLDKAAFDFHLTVPDGVFAAANGTLVGTTEDIGATTYDWSEPGPMAPYLATVVYGPGYRLVPDGASSAVAGVPVRHVLPRDLAARPPASLGRTGEMIAFLADRFGPFPFDRAGVAIVGGFASALETQTLVLVDRSLATAPAAELVLVHELAHEWFGNSVSVARWDDVWLNEGFATFAELLWVEREEGATAYRRELTRRREAVLRRSPPPPGRPPADDLFNLGVYERGALTLAALRDEVGDETFFGILRTYATRFRYGNATTADLVAVAEEVSGRDLEAFFTAWLVAPDLPD